MFVNILHIESKCWLALTKPLSNYCQNDIIAISLQVTSCSSLS